MDDVELAARIEALGVEKPYPDTSAFVRDWRTVGELMEKAVLEDVTTVGAVSGFVVEVDASITVENTSLPRALNEALTVALERIL